jgi:hypothetical protein
MGISKQSRGELNHYEKEINLNQTTTCRQSLAHKTTYLDAILPENPINIGLGQGT